MESIQNIYIFVTIITFEEFKKYYNEDNKLLFHALEVVHHNV